MDKQYNNKISESEIQKFWQENKVYAIDAEEQRDLYSVDTPPPTVSGSLHIGHIFSYTQTDIIARFKRMSGYSVFYPFGFDDNGLPTEKFVEKTLGVEAYTMKRSEFIDLCLKETAKVEKEFQSLWNRMGLSADWDNCYSTIDQNSRYISQLSFIELYNKGYIYRKEEPAIYCTACRTTVAQAELEDVEKPSSFNDIIFKSNDADLIIGTTRPELLPSTVALLYHPEDSRYQHLAGQKAITPIFGQEVPILADEDVVIEKGTGLVMVCTFGDKQDIVWAKRHNLKYRPSIGIDGKWTENTGALAGMRVATARKTILELLQKENLLLTQKPISHAVNVHERCKKEIEFLVLTQWFLKIMPYKEKFLELGNQIEWFPAFMKSRYENWVENISWDWCLSRQRFYGIPFPAWHCTGCNHILLAKKEELPLDPQESKYDGECPNCGSSNIVPDTDVMDTWNTSSLTPYICKSLYTKSKDVFAPSKKSFMPMSMRPQAHDIIRTWAFYTIIKSWMHSEDIPWENIVISGHVLAGQKQKISKSQGNNPFDPNVLLEKHPADALRYWTASARLGTDVSFSENQIAIGQKLITKLWNAFIFTKSHIENFDITKNEPKNLGLINEWILNNIAASYEKYLEYFEKNEFSLALDSVEKFFWHDFCDNYLELIKDQLFKPEKYNAEVIQATQWTLYHVGLAVLQLYAPFIPHVTDVIYSNLYKTKEEIDSLHQTKFGAYQQVMQYKESANTMQRILLLVSLVRKLKSENELSLKTELSELAIYTDADFIKILKDHENIIRGITHANSVEYFESNELPENKIAESNGFWNIKLKI